MPGRQNVRLLFLITVGIILNSFLSNRSFAQNESSYWYFGSNAGLNFKNGNRKALLNGKLFNNEVSACISDSTGDLLFYTDGENVYNKNHLSMSNGSGLFSDQSSTQGALIIRLPGSRRYFYIFTISSTGDGVSITEKGLCYSIVDIELDNGLGGIVQGKKNIRIREKCNEKLTAVKHSDGVSYWILINDFIEDNIHAYHFTENGINLTPVRSNVGHIHNYTRNTLGAMKASRNGQKIALATWTYNSFIVLDFNNTNGIASNRIDISGSQQDMNWTYGVEFSPSGRFLYGSTMKSPYKIYQFDLERPSASDIFINRKLLVSRTERISGCDVFYFGGLQIANDGKIYSSSLCDTLMSSINHPDKLAPYCEFSFRVVNLSGRRSFLGLPNFPYDLVMPILKPLILDNQIRICSGDRILLPNGEYTNQAGTYYDTIRSQFRDTIIRSNVKIIEPTRFSQTKYLCSGSSVQVADTSYSTPGTFIRKTKTRYGCDSIITTTIFIGFPNTIFVDSTRCRGEVVRIGTNTFADSDNYTVVLKNKYGCDSTVNLHLTIIEPKTSSGSFTVCEGEIVKDAGREFPNEGSFKTKLTALSTGCDSIRTTTISHIKIRVQTIPDSITKLQYGQALELQAIAEGTNLVYSWEPEDRVFCSTCPQTQTDSLTWNTLFTVNVRDTVFNCNASKTILAKVNCPIVVPNLVTPNGDNQNDYFRIKHLNCIDHVGSLKVFDRWGRQVYSESNLAPIPEIPLWQPSEPGIYFYQLTVNIVAGEPEQFLRWVKVIND